MKSNVKKVNRPTKSRNLQKKTVNKKIKKKKRKKYNSVNPYIFLVVLLLVAIGIVMVFSASYYDALYRHKDVYYFLKKELTWAPLGIFAMIVIMLIDYHWWRKFTIPAYVATAILLVAVLFVGKNINGATRWIDIAGISFQPSEIAKYVIVFFLAMALEVVGGADRGLKGPIIYLGFAAIFAGLVYKENNLSIASIIMIVSFIMIYVAGMKNRVAVGLIGTGLVAGFIGIFSAEYRRDRFMSFLNPWAYASDEGYQLIHSLYALGSGGLFGGGLGSSKQKALYMPEPHNDFIFAIIGEEFGLIGCLIVIILFVILILVGIDVAFKAKDKYGRYLAIGIVSVIGVQVLINIAVVTGSMPVTGVPLPFISYGGTSLVFNMAAMGVLLNISRQCIDPSKKEVLKIQK